MFKRRGATLEKIKICLDVDDIIHEKAVIKFIISNNSRGAIRFIKPLP